MPGQHIRIRMQVKGIGLNNYTCYDVRVDITLKQK